MPTVKLTTLKPVKSSTALLGSVNSASVSDNLNLIETQNNNKLTTYINVKNAVRILEKYSNENGYIKLYTEVESNFVIGDTVYITYTEPLPLPSGVFNLENPSTPFANYYLGYKIIKMNNYRNEIVINRYYNDITTGTTLKNQFLSKVSCRGGHLFDDISDGVVFKNCDVFDMDFGTIEGIVSGSTITGATITILNSSYRNNPIGSVTTSGSGGTYSINLPLGKNDLICRAPGYLTTGLTLSNVYLGTSTGNTIFMFTGTTTGATITTSGITKISSTGATCGGNITYDGGEIVTRRGVCWSTLTNPTILNSHTSDGTGVGSFISNLTFLSKGTTYFVRAYATNYNGTSYGSGVSFTTLAELPMIDTLDVSNITKTGATCGGNIIDTGGTGITMKGVCWTTGTTYEPTTGLTNTTFNGTGMTGTFVSSMIGLTKVSTYYVRAYAKNSVGISYGDTQAFMTLADIPSGITTTGITSITPTGLTCGGNIPYNGDGGAYVTSRGVCWSTGSTPTILNSRTVDESGTGSFSSYLSELIPSTKYWIKAYGTNSAGTGYGNLVSGYTEAVLPIVVTKPFTNISSTGFTSGGIVTYTGGTNSFSELTCTGMSYSTDPSNLPGNGIPSGKSKFSGTTAGITNLNYNIDVNGQWNYNGTSWISGLTPGMIYYTRAFAYNNFSGWTWGNLQSGRTLTVPSLTTNVITNISSTGLTTGGNITWNGGSSVIERGVCYSYAPFNDYCQTGSTNVLMINGTAIYGSQNQGEFDLLDNNMNVLYYNITKNNYLFPVNIPSGLIYTSRTIPSSGYTQTPTILNYKIENTTGSMLYTSNLTSLFAGLNYYVRAYAINSIGVGYGQILNVSTLGATPTVSTIEPTDIMPTSAISGGIISSDGYAQLQQMGICWGSEIDPTIDNHIGIKYGTNAMLGYFNNSITNLSPDVSYYVRAFAQNQFATGYGQSEEFITSGGLIPSIGTLNITNITSIELTTGVNLYTSGTSTITSMGVCWCDRGGSYCTPVFVSGSSSTIILPGPYIIGITNITLTGLTIGSSYNVRAYAENGSGIAYGPIKSGTTLSLIPTVSTLTASSIGVSGATCSGFVSFEGGSIIIEKGICYSTNHNPTTGDTRVSDGGGTGSTISIIDYLAQSTQYYFKAYAINSNGVGYGEEATFTTLSYQLPTIIINSTNYDSDTEICTVNCNITSDGNLTITQYGICWAISPINPTITGLHTEIYGTPIPYSFNNDTDLLLSTKTYNVRAYAINAMGTNYSDIRTFST